MACYTYSLWSAHGQHIKGDQADMGLAGLGNRWRLGRRGREADAPGFDSERAGTLESWTRAAAIRAIPNLLAVREQRLGLAVCGDVTASRALLHRVGRMIGRPFDTPLPLLLLLSDGRAAAGQDKLEQFSQQFSDLALFDTLFERRETPQPGQRLLLFVALAAQEINSSRIAALITQLAGAGGLAVVPEPVAQPGIQTVSQQARSGARTAIAEQLLAADWLPIFIPACGQEAHLGALDSERLARIIHELFLENAWTRGERQGATPALHPWRRLDETYRTANRSQAEHIACKLACGGLIATDEPVMADGTQAPLWSRPEFIEPLSRMEHDRWASDRLLDGWVHGATRDNAARRHPDLIPYDELTEPVREKDRVAVATIPFILQLGGVGWRPLARVRLTGRWPDPRGNARLTRRWRRDLARVAEERHPAVLEFLINPAVEEQCLVGAIFAEWGFPVSLWLPAQQSMSMLASDAGRRAALLRVLSLSRQVLWDDDWPQTPLAPLPLEAMVAERGGLRVERHLTGQP